MAGLGGPGPGIAGILKTAGRFADSTNAATVGGRGQSGESAVDLHDSNGIGGAFPQYCPSIMELLLIRRGLPVTVDNRATGIEADPGLSELGLRQAEALADWLTNERIDAIYASPKSRARQTVEPLASRLGVDVIVEPLVNEYDQGELEYIPIEHLKAAGDPRWEAMMNGDDLPNPEVFQAQVVKGIERIITANRGRTVVVGCHGGVVSAYLAHLLDIQRVMFYEAHYTSVARVAASSAGHRSVRSMNELGHLKVAGISLSDL